MFDVLMIHKVTVRRAKAGTRDVRNSVQHEQVKDETESPIILKCRFERRGRRILATDGQQTQSDATMFYNASRFTDLDLDDFIVNGSETYRIAGLAKSQLDGGGTSYARADLVLDRTDVPEDADAS